MMLDAVMQQLCHSCNALFPRSCPFACLKFFLLVKQLFCRYFRSLIGLTCLVSHHASSFFCALVIHDQFYQTTAARKLQPLVLEELHLRYDKRRTPLNDMTDTLCMFSEIKTLSIGDALHINTLPADPDIDFPDGLKISFNAPILKA